MTNVKMLENPIEAICLLIENSIQAGAKHCSVQMQYLTSAEKLVHYSEVAMVVQPSVQRSSTGSGMQKCLNF